MYRNSLDDERSSIEITHRFIIDFGIKPYIKGIAEKIVATLQSAIFGNYKVSCLIITGEMIHKWLKNFSLSYSDFIWKQLKEDIASLLYIKQLRTCLIMTKTIIYQDYLLDYRPLKLEKYRQVFSKDYYLDITSGINVKLKIYKDKGEYYEEALPVSIGNNQVWRIPLSLDERNKFSPCRIRENIYFSTNQAVEMENLEFPIRNIVCMYRK